MVKRLWRILQSVRSRLLWKIKRRLVLANIFIAVIPTVIVVAIFWFAGLLFYYQFSYYLISNQIRIHSAQIRAFSTSLKDRLQESGSGTESFVSKMKETLDSDTRFLLNSYPTAVIICNFEDPDTGRKTTYANMGSYTGVIDGYRVPEWIPESGFNGLVAEDVQPQIYNGTLFIRSFIASDFTSDVEFSLEVSVPFDQYFLDRLKWALGQDVLLAERVKIPQLNLILQNIDVSDRNIVDATFDTEKDAGKVWSGWLFSLFPISWQKGEERKAFDLGVLLVEPSAAKLMANIYNSENILGTRILAALKMAVIVFFAAEILSVFIGIRLTKSITGAVRSLDEGTEFVKRGDFSHRIVVRSGDQLGALAASFNQMTEYVQQLIRERVFKERMERELEIAKEVQSQLFPERAPRMRHLDISGTCLPARIVSGDYYDYLPLDGDGLALAVGDICGKGISAALLMANLQATLRSNVLNLNEKGTGRYEKNVAEIVRRLNSQMYGYTADNKFATLFYSVYNDTDRILTYCNAGHNPPLYIEGDKISELRVGGTIVGIFSDSGYEQESIQLHENGILVAYTDGIIECTNENDEEFGESRIIDLVQQNSQMDAENIKERIMAAALEWSTAERRADDMTLVVSKVL